MYQIAKFMINFMVKKGLVDEREVRAVIEEETSKEWFSFHGILSVFQAGLLNNNEFIPLLAPLLDRDDDLLLEEVSGALSRYQNDQTVQVVLPYAKHKEYYIFAIGVLKEIKTDLQSMRW